MIDHSGPLELYLKSSLVVEFIYMLKYVEIFRYMWICLEFRSKYVSLEMKWHVLHQQDATVLVRCWLRSWSYRVYANACIGAQPLNTKLMAIDDSTYSC